MRDALSQARTLNRLMALNGMQLLKQAPNLGLPINRSDMKEDLKLSITSYGICKPLPKDIPATSNGGTFQSVVPEVDAALKEPLP